MHRIPPELIDAIIDHLHAETEALRACSLVCHAWCRASQYHVFRRIVLRDPDATVRIEAALRDSPSLADYIQELHIHRLADARLLAMDTADPSPLARLPRVHKLLWNVPDTVFTTEIADVLTRLSPVFMRAIQHSFRNCRFDTWSTFVRLCSSPRLQHLAHEMSLVQPITEPVDNLACSPAKLRSLRIIVGGSHIQAPNRIFEAFRRTWISLSTLRELDISVVAGYGNNCAVTVAEVLTATSSTLETLKLRLSVFAEVIAELIPIIHTCVHLRALLLGGFDMQHPDTRRYPSWLPALLDGFARSQRLRSVTLDLPALLRREHVPRMPWYKIEAAVTQPRAFPALQHFKIRLHHSTWDVAQAEREIRTHLPLLRGRLLLLFTVRERHV